MVFRAVSNESMCAGALIEVGLSLIRLAFKTTDMAARCEVAARISQILREAASPGQANAGPGIIAAVRAPVEIEVHSPGN